MVWCDKLSIDIFYNFIDINRTTLPCNILRTCFTFIHFSRQKMLIVLKVAKSGLVWQALYAIFCMVCLILVNRVKNLVKISFFFLKFFETRNVDRLGGCRERSGVTSFAAASPVAHRPHNQRLITFQQKKFQPFWPKIFMKNTSGLWNVFTLYPFRNEQFFSFFMLIISWIRFWQLVISKYLEMSCRLLRYLRSWCRPPNISMLSLVHTFNYFLRFYKCTLSKFIKYTFLLGRCLLKLVWGG